jgi:hypothetical protein
MINMETITKVIIILGLTITLAFAVYAILGMEVPTLTTTAVLGR